MFDSLFRFENDQLTLTGIEGVRIHSSSIN
jgi:hypothetical protein